MPLCIVIELLKFQFEQNEFLDIYDGISDRHALAKDLMKEYVRQHFPSVSLNGSRSARSL
jgi:hypothetical protein